MEQINKALAANPAFTARAKPDAYAPLHQPSHGSQDDVKPAKRSNKRQHHTQGAAAGVQVKRAGTSSAPNSRPTSRAPSVENDFEDDEDDEVRTTHGDS